MLTLGELESITNDYFMADGRKAVDIYFNESFYMNYTMKQKKGIWERPNGGKKIRIPLEYDGQEGGFYSKKSTLNSTDVESINAAFLDWKHAYGNATIHRIDELENAGEYAEVQFAQSKISGAQKTVRKKIAQQIYALSSDGAEEITGLKSCCFGSASVKFQNIAENDLVASDNTKPWAAVNETTPTGITLKVIRDLRSKAKIGDGANGKPDIGMTTETLFNIVAGILQSQQRFTSADWAVKAGFTNLVFEGMTIAADDYCDAGYLFEVNTAYIGWVIHQLGYFARTPWGDLTPTGVPAKTLKIFFDGNQVVSNRKAHAGRSGLS